jgi:hypothetical protein
MQWRIISNEIDKAKSSRRVAIKHAAKKATPEIVV